VGHPAPKCPDRFLIAGLYSACYLLALDNGVTPGALATLLGVQPILTTFVTEKRVTVPRLLGLVFALAGLALVVSDQLMSMRLTCLGWRPPVSRCSA
jgi:drug/metabolite transporter (DMT)-like permease